MDPCVAAGAQHRRAQACGLGTRRSRALGGMLTLDHPARIFGRQRADVVQRLELVGVELQGRSRRDCRRAARRVLAPMITDITNGRCSTQASAIWATETPRASAIARMTSTQSKARSLIDRRKVEAWRRRAPSGPLPSRPYLPRQQAAGQRAPHHQAQFLGLAASARSRARGRGRRSCSRPAASRAGSSRASRRCPAPS